MTKVKKTYRQITSKEICQTYELLLDENLVSFPLSEGGKSNVEAIVANINNSYFGTEIYKTIQEKSVAYLYFLIKDHPFTDGNKRTACLVFKIFCFFNNLEPNFDDFKLDELAVFVERVKEDNHQKVIAVIADFIFNHK